MRRLCFIAIALLAAVAAGCVSYDERIEINPDGSGVVRMHLAVAEQVLGGSGDKKVDNEDELFPSPRKEIIADIEKQGFTVKDLRAESSGGARHFYIVLAFKSLDDLRKSELFSGREMTLTRENGKLSFRAKIQMTERTLTDRAGGPKTPETAPAPEAAPPAPKPSQPAPGAEAAPGETPKTPADGKNEKKDEPYVSVIKRLELRFGKERVRQMFSAYSINFSIEVPGATLLKTNGGNFRDAVAVWETPLNKLIESWPTIAMEADFALPTPAPASPEKKTP